MSPKYPIDLDQVRTFLSFLDEEQVKANRPFHFLWLGPKTEDPRARVREQNYMPFEGFAKIAQRKHDEGMTPYVGINKMRDAKRANANIEACRAHFVEFDDDAPLHAPDALPPDAIVQSRRGQHWYWSTKPEFETGPNWRAFQMALVDHFGGDKACTDPARVMRLPGSWHFGGIDDQPIQVELLKCDHAPFLGTKGSLLSSAYGFEMEPYFKLALQSANQNTNPWKGDLSTLPENLRQYFHCIQVYGHKIYKCPREPATWRTDCPLRKHSSGAHVVIKLNELGQIHQFCQAKEKHGCESDAIFDAFGLTYYARFPVR